MNYKQITLKPTTNKFVEINPCGARIMLQSCSISGLKAVPVKATVNEINRCIRCGLRVNELPNGARSSSKVPLNAANAARVFSEEHLEYLKKINMGYIDTAETEFAGNKIGVVNAFKPTDTLPNSLNNVNTIFVWDEYSKVIEYLKDETVTNKDQVVSEYTKCIMAAIARRIATSENVATIISEFKTVNVDAISTKISNLIAAMETAIKKDIYNKTVEIVDAPVEPSVDTTEPVTVPEEPIQNVTENTEEIQAVEEESEENTDTESDNSSEENESNTDDAASQHNNNKRRRRR